MLKREDFLVPRLVRVTNRVTNLLVASLLSPGLIACSTWKKTIAPRTAGVTVPYSRASPVCPLERTWKLTLTATFRLTSELDMGSGARGETRSLAFSVRVASDLNMGSGSRVDTRSL